MKLNRSTNQRKALWKTQLNSLITNGKITTTEAKAKEVKRQFDKLVSKAKVNSIHVRRQLAGKLSSVTSANRLVDVIAPLFPDRVSGFTSNSKEMIRKGDATTMVSLKLMAELPKATPSPTPRHPGASAIGSKSVKPAVKKTTTKKLAK